MPVEMGQPMTDWTGNACERDAERARIVSLTDGTDAQMDAPDCGLAVVCNPSVRPGRPSVRYVLVEGWVSCNC